MFLHTPPPPPPAIIPVTVWVHGTKPSSFLPSLTKKIQQQLDEVMHVPVGLHLSCELDSSLKHYKLTQTLSKAAPHQFPFDHMYLFGWSGMLDNRDRTQAADMLHTQLLTLQKQYQERQLIPEFTIISHSHGGNVVLQLPLYERSDDPLAIHRLILLACPVQKHTARYAAHTMFGHIYVLHSHLDMIQVLDPQRLHPLKDALQTITKPTIVQNLVHAFKQMIEKPLFSERHFPLYPHITHVNLTWSNQTHVWDYTDIDVFGAAGAFIKKVTAPLRVHHRGILHSEFELPTFASKLPSLLSSIEEMRANHTPSRKKPDLNIAL